MKFHGGWVPLQGVILPQFADQTRLSLERLMNELNGPPTMLTKCYGLDVSDEIPMTTQERAYTSPIWYTP